MFMADAFCTERYGFANRNSAKRRRKKKVAKKQKNFQKSVDKRVAVWYYSTTAKNAGGFQRLSSREIDANTACRI